MNKLAVIALLCLTGCGPKVYAPVQPDSSCESFEMILLDEAEWDTLSEESVRQIYAHNESLAVLCPHIYGESEDEQPE